MSIEGGLDARPILKRGVEEEPFVIFSPYELSLLVEKEGHFYCLGLFQSEVPFVGFRVEVPVERSLIVGLGLIEMREVRKLTIGI